MTERVGLRARVEGMLLGRILSLPEGVQRRLAGRPVVRDGQTLATEIQLILRLKQLFGNTDASQQPMAEGRRLLRRQAQTVGGRQPIAAVRDLRVDGAEGSLDARLYTPVEQLHATAAPTLMFLHGGGGIHGDLASHDAGCRFLANSSGVQVLAIDYRLAPEHPYPAGVRDSIAAYRWLVTNASAVNADPARLAVGGDSAGGYFAATTAVLAATEGLPLAFQLLLYPVTDFTGPSESRTMFGEGFFLTDEFIHAATEAYFPPGADRDEPLASVLRHTEFPAGLAPALVVTAGFDPLRDEGEAYAALLDKHGVEVETRRYPSMVHGFFNIVGVGHEARAHNREIAGRLRAALAG